jgi:hypothetical protein
MTIKDNGDWLSAEQAVRPDGTEVQHLSLINKKLPPLSDTSHLDTETQNQAENKDTQAP